MGNDENSYSGDATASFSGFLYQADIALLKVLEKIEVLDDTELGKWSLEVEGEEDFTLYKKENETIIFREAYQVKETASTSLSGYTIPVIKLFEEFNKGGNKKEFLATEKEINYADNIDFFDGLYSGDELSKDQGKLKYLFEGNTFLKEKINYEENRVRVIGTGKKAGENTPEQYKFNDGETKDTIKLFVQGKISEFIKDENFGYIFCGDVNIVQGKIVSLIQRIKIELSDGNNHFKFLESKIKRHIQNNKGIEYRLRKKMSLLEIKKDLDRDIQSYLPEDYQDMFFNIFKKVFNLQFQEVYAGKNCNEDNIESIYVEVGNDEDFNNFLDRIRNTISRNIFIQDNSKLISLIKYVIGDHTVECIDNIQSFSNFQAYEEKLLSIKPKVKNFIQMVVSYFYARDSGGDLIDNYFYGEDVYLGIRSGNNNGVITGLSSSKSDIKYFLQSTLIDLLYEKSHLGIFNVDHNSLHEHLGYIKEEQGFVDTDLLVQERIEKYCFDVTKIKDIKIFSGKKCLNENDYKFMD